MPEVHARMFRFIHASDLHLDSPLQGLEAHEGAPLDVLRGATRRAFENLVHLAIDERVDFVIIAGDHLRWRLERLQHGFVLSKPDGPTQCQWDSGLPDCREP